MSGADDVSASGERAAAHGRTGDSTSGGGAIPPEEQVFYCDLCGNQMLNLHCKLVCEQCGYKRDCSDP
jgi:hypothetical protein